MSKTGEWGDKIIITLFSDGSRRHKKWCEHYRSGDGYCTALCRKCVSSTHCEHYKSSTGQSFIKKKDVICTPIIVSVDEPKPTLREFYRLATRADKLLGKTVLVKINDSTFRIGIVCREDFYNLYIEYDERIHTHDKRTVFNRGSLYLLTETEIYERVAD